MGKSQDDYEVGRNMTSYRTFAFEHSEQFRKTGR